MRKPTLAEAKGRAVSHDQTVGYTPGVILPALTAYPKHAREPPDMVGNLVAKVTSRCDTELSDLCATAHRADGRLIPRSA